MAEAKQYIALEGFKFRGVFRKKGDVFRITDEKAEKLGGKVKLVSETASAPVAPLPKTKMAQYKVKESFELEGVNQEVDAVVELSDEKAAELGEKVEKVEAATE